jgi:NNP family nitrate/nitrite transporter-like MFS transporter
MAEVSAANSFRSEALNVNTWLLFVQYACCFGVELTMNNAVALYFREEFGQTTESAAAIALIFGWMNLFAHGLGGFISDMLNARMGMKGRIWANIWAQTICLAIEGAMVLIFANTGSLAGSIVVLVFFSIFVQSAEGTSYGIFPYVDLLNTGSIAGIIGAGGNTGAVCFGLGFRQLSYKDALVIKGSCIIASSVLSIFVVLPGHAGTIWGKDDPSQQNFLISAPKDGPPVDEEEGKADAPAAKEEADA